jgi:hypothetical protein
VGTGGAGARFAACMRAHAIASFPDPNAKGTITLTVSQSHGVPNYPDPTFSSGGITQGFSPGSGTDSSTRIFQAAQRTCQTQRTQKP